MRLPLGCGCLPALAAALRGSPAPGASHSGPHVGAAWSSVAAALAVCGCHLSTRRLRGRVDR
eukprot:121632-Alexandrium_andersonii.AAC.1